MKDAGARPEAMQLTQLQRWFQTVVTHAEGVEAGACSEEAQRLIQLAPGELERVITRSRALTAAERLAIYANAYHTRLLECLGEVFPMLKRTLGEDGFDGLAFGYLQEYPSRSYTLNELGRHFPQYLEQSRPAPEDAQSAVFDPSAPEDAAKLQEWNERSPPPQPSPPGERETPMENWPDFLIDLARLEWAIYEVFDGPGIEGRDPLAANQLLAIPPERWEGAKLAPVVCLQLLATRFPVNDYYTALRRAKAADAVPIIPSAEESFVALTRRNFVVRRYNLSRVEFELLRALQADHPIGEAIASIAPAPGIEFDQLAAQLQLWFRNWTAEGFFQSVSIDPSNEGERI
jgi:hypothetical protein